MFMFENMELEESSKRFKQIQNKQIMNVQNFPTWNDASFCHSIQLSSNETIRAYNSDKIWRKKQYLS